MTPAELDELRGYATEANWRAWYDAEAVRESGVLGRGRWLHRRCPA